MFILTANQMKTADGYAIHTLGIPGATLMGRAAQGIAETIAEMTPNARRAVLVCGSGNNGGDGLALAGILARGGVSVTVVLSSARALSEDAAYYFNRLPEQVRTLRFTDDSAACLREIAGADIAVDALYGTGFDGYIRPDHGRMIWGEHGRPGYGLYDRALGAVYLEGLWEAITKNASHH